MSTHNLCFEQKYEQYQNFYLKNFQFLVVKFSIYLNRRVFVMVGCSVFGPVATHYGAILCFVQFVVVCCISGSCLAL